MTESRADQANLALQQAYLALQEGDRRSARRLAERATALAPGREEPWLFLAALAGPRASIAYLKQALEINPGSQRARQAMHWAAGRLRATRPAERSSPSPVEISIAPDGLVRSQPHLLTWALAVLVLAAAVVFWFARPSFTLAFAQSRGGAPAQVAQFKPTYTPTPTATFTPTPTFTPTATPTSTPTATPTSTATSTPTVPPTATPVPPDLPEGVGVNEPWIDIDLSEQRAYAYRGTSLMRSFVISTGTWRYPTVIGQYRIYVKYRYADMAGPGYYLPDVPYVMYFYQGYGLHGTYWHNNFGTPMSHGCVNFTIPDAGWVFDFTEVGTVVNVHD